MPLRTLQPVKPFWTTYNDDRVVRLYQGNVTKVLAGLPAQSFHMTVCSPPYWGLRSYLAKDHPDKKYEIGSEPIPDCKTDGQAQCGRCFVCSLVAVFRGVYRVLRDDGTLWLNLGDTYGGGKIGRTDLERNNVDGFTGSANGAEFTPTQRQSILPPGNLIGIPWRVALALQADGWILRQDIIWSKLDPMPESVKNRCTKSHEYIFLFTKKQGYYYDAEAIKEVSNYVPNGRAVGGEKYTVENGSARHQNGRTDRAGVVTTGFSNKRSVWRVSAGGGYAGAHFATFPERLIKDCILAGTSATGCCSACGAPWKRIVKETQLKRERPNEFVKRQPVFHGGTKGTPPGQEPQSDQRGVNVCNNTVAGVFVETVGWEPTCECNGQFETQRIQSARQPAKSVPGYAGSFSLKNDGLTNEERMATLSETVEKTKTIYVSDLPLNEHPVVPCTVLDPFCGAATTQIVSLVHGRNSVGIDLSEDYLTKNAIPRIRGRLVKLGKTALLHPLPKAPPVVLNGHKFYS